MQEICTSGSEGGGTETNRSSLPLSMNGLAYQAAGWPPSAVAILEMSRPTSSAPTELKRIPRQRKVQGQRGCTNPKSSI